MSVLARGKEEVHVYPTHYCNAWLAAAAYTSAVNWTVMGKREMNLYGVNPLRP